VSYVELLPPDAHRTPGWYERRKPGISASEIAAVLGLSPYESPWSLWHRKKGLLEPQPDNEAMEWGRRIEALIVAKFAERHPEFHVRPLGLCASERRPWQLATPDGAVEDVDRGPGTVAVAALLAGVEAKTTDSWDGWGDEGTDDIPVLYRCQTLWQADVLGVDCVYLPALSRGKDYREYVVVRDDAAEADLIVMRLAAQQFLASLEGDEPPPLDAHPATTKTLRALHPTVEDADVVVPLELAATYVEARLTMELAKIDLDGATNELLAAIGDGRRAVDPEGRRVATRIVSERRSLDTKALAADHPELAKKYQRTTTVAQLRAAPAPKKKETIR
jgi:putative phage-type endonuclease